MSVEYLLQESGGFRFVLEDDSGFILLESVAYWVDVAATDSAL